MMLELLQEIARRRITRSSITGYKVHNLIGISPTLCNLLRKESLLFHWGNKGYVADWRFEEIDWVIEQLPNWENHVDVQETLLEYAQRSFDLM